MRVLNIFKLTSMRYETPPDEVVDHMKLWSSHRAGMRIDYGWDADATSNAPEQRGRSVLRHS